MIETGPGTRHGLRRRFLFRLLGTGARRRGMASGAATALLDKRAGDHSGFLLWGVVAVGAVLRLIGYLNNRSLWGDETSLALNVVWRSFRQLMEPLQRRQIAPLGFLWLSKLGATALGPDGWGLRLLPLLAALGVLPVMVVLARRLVSPAGAVAAVALVAFNPWLIAYASEFKPYSIEVLAAALITLLLLRLADRPESRPRLAALALASGVFPWLGLGATFVVAGIWLTLGLWLVTDRRFRRAISQTLVVALAVGLAVAAAIATARPASGERKAVNEEWEAQRGFPPPLQATWSDRSWFPEAGSSFLKEAGGFDQIGLATGLSVVGIAALWRTKRHALMALLMPAVALLAASWLHLYPFVAPMPPVFLPSGARCALFLTPALALVIGAAGDPIWNAIGRPGRVAVSLLLVTLLFHPTSTAVSRAVTPPRFLDMRQAWLGIRDRLDDGDVIYVNSRGLDALEFYRKLYPPQSQIKIGTDFDEGRSFVHWLDARAAANDPPRRIWLVFCQHPIWDLREVRQRLILRALTFGVPSAFVMAPGVEARLFGPARARQPRPG
jgi:hypothetical protein